MTNGMVPFERLSSRLLVAAIPNINIDPVIDSVISRLCRDSYRGLHDTRMAAKKMKGTVRRGRHTHSR